MRYIIIFFILLINTCISNAQNNNFEFKKTWKDIPTIKKIKHRTIVDKVVFEFYLPNNMLKGIVNSKHISVYGGKDCIEFYSNNEDEFFIQKVENNLFSTDTVLIKKMVNTYFYNIYSLSKEKPYYNSFVLDRGYMEGYPYFTVLFNQTVNSKKGYIRDTIRTKSSKVFAINGNYYVFTYDSKNHFYEVPLEEKLAVMKSIRIISKEEAKAEEEKNTAGNIKFLISMLALLFLVCIGSKLNNRK